MGFEKQYRRIKPLEYQSFRIQEWTDPVASSASYVKAGATSNSASTTSVTTGITSPDVPRSLAITPGGTTADVKACNITITGTDIEGQSITEAIAFIVNQSTISTASTAFKTVTSIVIPPQDGDGATFDIGVGVKLGLDRKLVGNSVLHAICSNVFETTRPTVAVSEDTISANTIQFNTAPNGTRDYEILYYYDLSANPQ